MVCRHLQGPRHPRVGQSAAAKALAVGLAFWARPGNVNSGGSDTPQQGTRRAEPDAPDQHMCVIVFAASVGLMLTYWAHERAAARKRALLVVAFYAVLFVTMGVFYAAIGADVETTHWSERYAAAPWLRST